MSDATAVMSSVPPQSLPATGSETTVILPVSHYEEPTGSRTQTYMGDSRVVNLDDNANFSGINFTHNRRSVTSDRSATFIAMIIVGIALLGAVIFGLGVITGISLVK